MSDYETELGKSQGNIRRNPVECNRHTGFEIGLLFVSRKKAAGIFAKEAPTLR